MKKAFGFAFVSLISTGAFATPAPSITDVELGRGCDPDTEVNLEANINNIEIDYGTQFRVETEAAGPTVAKKCKVEFTVNPPAHTYVAVKKIALKYDAEIPQGDEGKVVLRYGFDGQADEGKTVKIGGNLPTGDDDEYFATPFVQGDVAEHYFNNTVDPALGSVGRCGEPLRLESTTIFEIRKRTSGSDFVSLAADKAESGVKFEYVCLPCP